MSFRFKASWHVVDGAALHWGTLSAILPGALATVLALSFFCSGKAISLPDSNLTIREAGLLQEVVVTGEDRQRYERSVPTIRKITAENRYII